MKKITAVLLVIFVSMQVQAQVCGCTDPLASNYNAAATINDGSCTYGNALLSAVPMGDLDEVLFGTSGMIFWNDGYWTYNDHSNTFMYEIDSTNAAIVDSLLIVQDGNDDTEEISQDSLYLYFGDFGNNAGCRTDLHLLRVSKQGLCDNDFTVDTIFFSFADQADFTASVQATDFDCEAFIVGSDSIYVFTKQWVSEGTVCYGFPKEPGTQIATPCGTCNVGGLITGATYFPTKRLVVLCGYSSALQPFFYLLYDFQGQNFFSGNKRKLNFPLLTRAQVEAIASSDALHYYITNEDFVYQEVIPSPAKLQQVDLTNYLEDYLERLSGTSHDDTTRIDDNLLIQTELQKIYVIPNPVSSSLRLSSPFPIVGCPYEIYDLQGRILGVGNLKKSPVDVAQLSKGQYVIVVHTSLGKMQCKFIKQ